MNVKETLSRTARSGMRLGAFAAWSVAVSGLAWAEGEVPSGEIEIPVGQTQTITDASGKITVTGGGTLVVAFDRDYVAPADIVDFEVRAGELVLRETRNRGGNVTVAEGALLKLDGVDVIRDGKDVILHGTFDLNGHSETLGRCGYNPNSSDVYRTKTDGLIVNTSDSPAYLRCSGQSLFYGRIVEEHGKITLDPGSAASGLFGPDGAMAFSELSVTAAGILPFSQSQEYKFEFRAPADGTNRIAISEIQLTYGGKPIDRRWVSGHMESGHEGSKYARNVSDDQSSTCWQASSLGADAWVSIRLSAPAKVDGYRIAPFSAAGAPSGWRVWTYRWTTCGYILADDRWNTSMMDAAKFDKTFTPLYSFSASDRLGSVLSPNTAVALTSKASDAALKNLRVSSVDPFVTGALSGAGGIFLEAGSIIAPGSLNGYTGVISADPATCSSFDTEAGVLLDVRGGDEQRVRISTENAHLAIGNATAEPVAVLLDDESADQPLHGRLTDANGPLGLVKRGTGVRALETEDADATGPVRVEAGTLRLQGLRTPQDITARYIRIHVTKMWGDGFDDFTDTVAHSHSSGPAGMNWGMNEFELLDAEGRKVAWPAGTTVTHSRGLEFASGPLRQLIDGNFANRCLIYNDAATIAEAKTTDASGHVIIDTGSAGVTFRGYQWYTPHGNAYDSKRTPTVWTIAVSADRENWTTVHLGETPWVPDSTAYGATTPGILRGPFACTGASHSSGANFVQTIPEAFLVSTNRGSRAPALKARYFRFRPFATVGGSGSTTYGWQIAELSLYRNGQAVAWNDAVAEVTGASVNRYNNSKVENCVNNVKVGGSADDKLERCFVERYPSYLTVDAGQEVEFDAWGFTSSGGGGYAARIPTAFDLAVSEDGESWTVVSSVLNHKVVAGSYQDQGPWSVGGVYPLAGLRDNRLGDDAPVTIASGATLQVAADYERIGPLSGAGALDLDLDATLDINAASGDGAFSGAVTGGGTLVLSGAGAQAFDGADLTGVKTLEFAGGAFAGTARFATLSVTGSPKFVLPNAIGVFTFVTAEKIDAESIELLRQAELLRPAGMPKGWRTEVTVTGKAFAVEVRKSGMMLLFR